VTEFIPAYRSTIYGDERQADGVVPETPPAQKSRADLSTRNPYVFWDVNNPDYTPDWDVTIGATKFVVPPLAMTVTDVTSNSVLATTLRSTTSSKFAPGRKQRRIEMKLFFPNLTELWEGKNSLRSLIVQFKSAPFLPVTNAYLNEVQDIDALALNSISVSTVPGYPFAVQVELVCYQFNWRVYVPLGPGKTARDIIIEDRWNFYYEKARDKLNEYVGPPFLHLKENIANIDSYIEDVNSRIGEYGSATSKDAGEQLIAKNYKHNEIQLGTLFGELSFEETASALELYYSDRNYAPESWMNNLRNYGNVDDPIAIATQLKTGYLSFIQNLGIKWILSDTGLDLAATTLEEIEGLFNTDEPSLQNQYAAFNAVISMMEYSSYNNEEKTEEYNKALAKIRERRPEIPAETASRLAWTGLLMSGLDNLLASEDIRKVMTDNRWRWLPEWEFPMRRFGLLNNDLKKSVIVESITVTSQNAIVALPIEGKVLPAHQHLGNLGISATLKLKVIGERALTYIRQTFDNISVAALGNREVGVSGFLGVENNVLNVMGMRYALVDTYQVSTIPGQPHTYDVTLQLSDFDILQQKKEQPGLIERLNIAKQMQSGNTIMRAKQELRAMSAYPDLPLPRQTIKVNRLNLTGLENSFGYGVGQEEGIWVNGPYYDPDFYFRRALLRESDPNKPTRIHDAASTGDLNRTPDYSPGEITLFSDEMDASIVFGQSEDTKDELDRYNLSMRPENVSDDVVFPPGIDPSISLDDALNKMSIDRAYSPGNEFFTIGDNILREDAQGQFTLNTGRKLIEQDIRANIKHMLADREYRDLTGRMCQAFPTCVVYLIDEGGSLLTYKLFDTFYGMQALISVDVMTDKEAPLDSAIIQFSNIYQKLSTPQWYQSYSLPKFISDIVKSTWSTQQRGLGYVSEMDHIKIEPGMRMQIRFGYSANPENLDVVFNGTVSEVNDDTVMTVTLAGDGNELAIISSGNWENGAATAGHFLTVPFVEPQDLIIKYLAAFGSNNAQWMLRASAGIYQGGEITSAAHFGSMIWDLRAYGGLEQYRTILKGRTNDIYSNVLSSINTIENKDIWGGALELLGGSASNIVSALWNNWTNINEDFELYKRNIYPGNGTGGRVFTNMMSTQPSTGLGNIIGEWYRSAISQTDPEMGNGPTDAIQTATDAAETGALWSSAPGVVAGVYIGAKIGGTLGLAFTPVGAIICGAIGGVAGAMIGYSVGAFNGGLTGNSTVTPERIFRLNTSGKTNWEIMKACEGILPNYILAVRPFEHRSTLFYGKQNWLYTSGVIPVFDSSAVEQYNSIEGNVTVKKPQPLHAFSLLSGDLEGTRKGVYDPWFLGSKANYETYTGSVEWVAQLDLYIFRWLMEEKTYKIFEKMALADAESTGLAARLTGSEVIDVAQNSQDFRATWVDFLGWARSNNIVAESIIAHFSTYQLYRCEVDSNTTGFPTDVPSALLQQQSIMRPVWSDRFTVVRQGCTSQTAHRSYIVELIKKWNHGDGSSATEKFAREHIVDQINDGYVIDMDSASSFSVQYPIVGHLHVADGTDANSLTLDTDKSTPEASTEVETTVNTQSTQERNALLTIIAESIIAKVGSAGGLFSETVQADMLATLQWQSLLDNSYYGILAGTENDPYAGADQIKEGLIDPFNITSTYFPANTPFMELGLARRRRIEIMTDNPFTREFGEPVLEVREPFSRWHTISSTTNLVNNGIFADGTQVYNQIRAIGHTGTDNGGEKNYIIKADSSIPPSLLKEKIYDTGMNFEWLNMYDDENLKNIGRYALKRSLQQMYGGELIVLGDSHMRPFDFVWLWDVPNRTTGSCEIERVTHQFSIQTGYITSVKVAPIIVVDDAIDFSLINMMSSQYQSFSAKQELASSVATGFVDLEQLAGVQQEIDRSARAREMLGIIDGNLDSFKTNGLETIISMLLYGILREEDPALSSEETEAKAKELMDELKGDLQAHMVGGAIVSIPIMQSIGLALAGTVGGYGGSILWVLAACFGASKLYDVLLSLTEMEPISVMLLSKDGYPLQAGLKGSTGIIQGQPASIPILTDFLGIQLPPDAEETIWQRLGYEHSTAYDIVHAKNLAVARASRVVDEMSGRQETILDDWLTSDMEVIETTVLGIVDGDTIYISTSAIEGNQKIYNGISSNLDRVTGGKTKVRFLRVDAPEVAKEGQDLSERKPPQYGGPEISEFVKQRLGVGTTVKLLISPIQPVDQYGRPLAYIVTPFTTSYYNTLEERVKEGKFDWYTESFNGYLLTCTAKVSVYGVPVEVGELVKPVWAIPAEDNVGLRN
jgi:endonuclease YncB( thermonuclease family)